MSNLLEFYGLECPHCHRMDPLVSRLEKELNVKLEKIEVWHNEKNSKKMDGYDKGYCGGVPFFYNTRSNQWLCGEVNYETLKEWAMR